MTRSLPGHSGLRPGFEVLIIPVILALCSWWGFVDDLQVVPTSKGRVSPISNRHPHESGYVQATFEVIQGIRRYWADLKQQNKPTVARDEGRVTRHIQA